MSRTRGKGLIAALGFILAMGSASASHAQLMADKLWLDFGAQRGSRDDVVLRNDSKDRYYITIETSEITAPGTDGEQRTKEADPEKLGLIVSPNRIVLEPGSSRAIRVVSLNHNLTADRVYRIRVTPQVGEIQADQGGANNRTLAVKVLTAYDVLVVDRPDKPTQQLQGKRDGGKLILENAGNSNVLLFDGVACPPGETTMAKCDKLEDRRLYAANRVTLPVKNPNYVVHYRMRTSAHQDPVNFDF